MPLVMKKKLLAALGALTLIAGGIAIAQLETADRGILPVDNSGTLEISGIHVDVAGETPEEARYAGWRVAQREGFRQLWAKLNKSSPDKAPRLTDSALDQLVSAITVEREQIGPKRYIADLGVLFDRTRAGAILGTGERQTKSPPFLLIPLTQTGGAATTIELKNPWQRAWAQYGTAQSPIDYVRASGLGPDPLLVQAGQVRRPGRAAWRNLLDYYGASNVLIASVKLDRAYPGGPAVGHFTAYVGPDRERLGSFTLNAADSNGIAAMMNEAVAKMDTLFSAAFATGRLKADQSLAPPPAPVVKVDSEDVSTVPATQVQVVVAVPNRPQLDGALAALRSASGVDRVIERSIALGGNSILVVSYQGEAQALANAMAAKGWTVDYQAGVIRMSAPGAINGGSGQ